MGSERTITNSSQSATASLTLSAFGQAVASSGSSTSAYQFGATSGYRSEGDAGLTLVGCRFYDAQVGEFLTRDTHLDQDPYAYCDGDPVNATDPSGHNAILLVPILFEGGPIGWGLLGIGVVAIGVIVAVNYYRDKKNKPQNPWVKRGLYPGQNPHYDPDPSGHKGGPHWDWPRKNGTNESIPEPNPVDPPVRKPLP